MLIAQTILNHLQIASPCSADWASMSGDERCRHCAQCDKRVYDISALRADEALALIQEGEGHLCVRLWRRADGTVLTADCPMGRRVHSRRRIYAMASAAPLLALALNCKTPEVKGSVARETRGQEVTITVGGAVASMDFTSSRQGASYNSEDLQHLPIR